MGRDRDEIQAEAVAAIESERQRGIKSTLLQMPTQTGKTRTTCKFIRQALETRNARVLVVAHMGELLVQFGKDLEAMGIPFAIEKAEQKAHKVINGLHDVRVFLASKDTLQGKRLQLWPKDFFTDVIEDECHLATTKTWGNVHKHFESAFRLGLTATIDRLDGVPLSTIFESTAYCYSITDAITNGHRCKFMAVPCDVDIDIRGIRANSEGTLAPGELEAKVGPELEKIANVVRMQFERLGIKKAISFLPNKNLAYAFAQILTQIGIPSAGVDGDNPDRDAIIKAHKAGEYQVLTNVKLLGMGYNDPGIDAVIDLSPTTSRAWFDQKAGRCGATREGKEFGYLLYVGWNSKLSLKGPTDIFAVNDPPNVQERAKKLAEKKKDADPQALLEQARAEVSAEAEKERLARERRLRYEAKQREIKHKYREYDPIGVAVNHYKATSGLADSPAVTAEQLKKIGDLGLKALGSITTSASAESVIKFWESNVAAGMITPKQFNILHGFVGPEKALRLSSKQAGVVMAVLKTADRDRVKDAVKRKVDEFIQADEQGK